MRTFSSVVFLIFMAGPAFAEPDIIPLMEDYYSCLVGKGAYAKLFTPLEVDGAFASAKAACVAPGKVLRDTVPLVSHEQGEENEADFIEGAALQALGQLH